MPPRPKYLALLMAIGLFLPGCHEIDYSSRFAPGEIEIFDDLFSVSAGSEKVVVSVGYYGAIYRSGDAGDTWSSVDSGTQSSLYDVSMADERRGWIVGQRGLILRTTDGGQSWTRQPNLKETQGTHLFAVHALDANSAWAVGEWGTRLFTDDGGSTWQDLALTIDETHPQFVWLAPVEQERVRSGQKVYEDVGLNDVYCLPAPSKSCWLIGEFGYIFRSGDMGHTWERGQIIGDIHIDRVEMPFDQTELTDADAEKLTKFAQVISDQQHLNIEVEPQASAQEIARFGKEDDPEEFFEILDARALNVRSVLEEAGILSDRIRMRAQPPWDYEEFLEDDPGFLKRYFEGRRAPTPGVDVRVAQNPYLFTINFRDESRGLISGLGGVVLRSEDGGRTWRYVDMDRKQALFSVDWVDGRSIVVGEKGMVRVSTDGGLSWAPPPSGFPTLFTFLRDIDFAPGKRLGFIVGQRGMVLRSADQGVSWSQVLPPESRRFAEAD